jgi:hypothetical protein
MLVASWLEPKINFLRIKREFTTLNLYVARVSTAPARNLI